MNQIDVFDSWGWAVYAATDELSHICGTVVCTIGVFFYAYDVEKMGDIIKLWEVTHVY